MKIDKNSLIFKLSIKNGIFLCIAFTALFGVICMLNRKIIYNKEEQVFTSYLYNTMTSIDDKLKDMSRVSLMTMADEQTQEVLLSYQDMSDEEKREQQEYLSEFYQSLVTIRNDIHGIYIMDLEELLFYYDMENPTLKEGVDAVAMAGEIVSMENDPMLMSNCSLVAAPQPQFMRYSGYYGTDPYYSNCIWLVRDIYGFSPHEKIGTIALTAPIAKIQELLENTLGKDMFYLLVSKSGRIVCSQNSEYLLKNIEDINTPLAELLVSGETGTIEWEGKDSFVMHTESKDSGLVLLVGKPTGVILREITGFLGYYIILCIGVILLISSAFKSMMDALENLAEKQYKDKVRIQEGMLKEQNLSMLYLKSQVNPHFLYNTLDTIRINAQMNGDKEVSDMLMQLVEFFRLSVKVDAPVVTLEHEIDLIETYMNLMCTRYPEICWECDVDPDLLDAEVPNFILQPIVENSILHGLRNKGYKGNLTVIVRRRMEDNSYIEILVKDDGIGFGVEGRARVQELLYGEERDASDAKSIGIRNIQNRLQMFYSKECGLSYIEEKNGITACILIKDKIGKDTGEEIVMKQI